MSEITQQATPHPTDTTSLVYALGEYLHTHGVVADPDTGEGDGVPVFAYELPPTPDDAVVIYGVTADHAVSNSNPRVRFIIATRSTRDDWNTPDARMHRIFELLHDHVDIQLTATQRLLSCRRVVNDPTFRDDNRRWYRLDTYEAILAAQPQ